MLKRLNIIISIFSLFICINNFEVINAFHTAYKHFSTSFQWILVILKTNIQILEPKITCADAVWGFVVLCI